MSDIASLVLGILKYVGGIIPQEVKDKVSQPLSHVILYRCNVADIQKKLEELKLAKYELEATLLVAETNGDHNMGAIKTCLDAINKILSESEGREGNMRFCCGSAACEAGKMLDEIKKALEKSNGFEWVSGPGSIPPPIGSRYNVYNKNLRSREDILVNIFKTLEDNNIIGLCGIPGVGKTTLLEELIKRAEADNLFQVIAKLDMSQRLDIKMIQASIASRIQLDLTVREDDEETRANFLYRGLENRKSTILLIFDHICSVTDFSLTKIGIPFPVDGCKILVSARSSDVCNQTVGNSKIVQLDCLSPAEAKVLFRDKLGDQIPDEEYNSEFYISNENSILQSCGNLPMAITATAEALKVRWSRRHDIVRDLRKYDLSQDDGVKQTLNQVNKMLFNLLEDDREKKIFLLCCLFQPGSSIPVESLIRYGMGLKLFSTVTKLDDIMEQANLLVNRLKSLRLLENKDGFIGMNAILHDFAVSTALEEKYLLMDEGGQNDDTRENFTIISSTTKSGINGSESAQRHLNGLNSPKVEAMFLKGKDLNLQHFDFKGIENLRVLVMTEMKLSALPPSIEHLKNLFTFCVEDCEIQDASVVSVLLGLEVLSFHGSKLEAFPSGITNLKKLRVLDLAEFGFASLSHLEGLLADLKHFNLLEALEIEIPSQNAGDLSLTHNLQSFKIAIGCKVPSPYKNLPDRVLLLQDIDARICMPQAKMQGLQILLEKAEFLNLVDIKNLRSVYYHLDSKGFLDLKFLHISSCNQMKCVLNGNGDVDVNMLPKLESLSLEQMEGLEVIYTGRMAQNWCSQLRELKLLNLKELKCYALLIEHAHKLVLVEVADCPKLNYFFSTCSTSEISSIGEHYDLPLLKKLDLRRLPSLKGLWTDKKQESDIKDQTDQLLFNEKISLTSLEELYLSSLYNIKELWSEEIREESLGFRSLKEIRIVDCVLLESLCTPSVLAALSGLVTLQISSSSNMKEVIKTETNSENSIKFPSLRRLKLKELQSLQWFSQGSCTAELPSLEKLSLSSLPNMLSFHESGKTPFITEIVFPNLEHLKLTDMEGIEELVKEEECASVFQKLKTLTIIKLGSLKFIPTNLLEKIEQLKVHTCASLLALFDSNFNTRMSYLTRLELVDVSCCENVPWELIPNIQSLVVHRSLLNLQSMLSSTQIVGCEVAQKLLYMSIEGCDNLKEIVSNEHDEQDQANLEHGTAMFPRLKHIEIRALPSMTTFSSGNYETTFPDLEQVDISGCPNLVSFSRGTLLTPKLSTLHLDGDQLSMTNQHIDLNGFLSSQLSMLQSDEHEMHPSESRLASGESFSSATRGGGGGGSDVDGANHTTHNSASKEVGGPEKAQNTLNEVPSQIVENFEQVDLNQIYVTYQPTDLNCIKKSQGQGNHQVQNEPEQTQERLQSTEHEVFPSKSLLVIRESSNGAIDDGVRGVDRTSHNPGSPESLLASGESCKSAIGGDDDDDNGADHTYHSSGSEEVGEPEKDQNTIDEVLGPRVENFRQVDFNCKSSRDLAPAISLKVAHTIQGTPTKEYVR